jgi:hypothetical protein
MTERTSLSAVAAATWITGTACHAAHTEPAEAFYMNRAVRFRSRPRWAATATSGPTGATDDPSLMTRTPMPAHDESTAATGIAAAQALARWILSAL